MRSAEDEVVYEFTPDPTPALAPRVPGSAYSHGFGAKFGADDGLDTKELPAAEAFETFRQAEAEVILKPKISARPVYERLGGSVNARAFEPPEERLARLQAEVAELLELADSAASKDGEEALELLGSDPSAVTSELRVLEQRLGGLARDGPEAWRAASNTNSGSGQFALSQALLNQLDRFATATSSSSSATGASADAKASSSRGHVVYELSYTPAVSALADSSRVASLESAVVELEKRAGVLGESARYFPDLQTAVSQLQNRLSLVDMSKLETVSRRVQVVMGEIDSVLARKAELLGTKELDADMDRKVNELYEFCHCWSATAASLPALVERLQSLQVLHQQGATLASRLEHLERQQDELARLLETTTTTVQELGTSLKENMIIMKDNMQCLESKIAAAMKQ